jgi:hypothetical protein
MHGYRQYNIAECIRDRKKGRYGACDKIRRDRKSKKKRNISFRFFCIFYSFEELKRKPSNSTDFNSLVTLAAVSAESK